MAENDSTRPRTAARRTSKLVLIAAAVLGVAGLLSLVVSDTLRGLALVALSAGLGFYGVKLRLRRS